MKKDYSYLAVAVGAIIVTNFMFPIIDATSAWIQNKINLSNAKMNKKFEALNEENDKQNVSPVPAIGFAIPNETEETIED